MILISAGLGLHITTRKHNYLYTFVYFLFFYSHKLIFLNDLLLFIYIYLFFHLDIWKHIANYFIHCNVVFILSLIFSYLFIVISVGLSPHKYAVLHLPICKHIIWWFFIIYHFLQAWASILLYANTLPICLLFLNNDFKHTYFNMISMYFSAGLGLHLHICKHIAGLEQMFSTRLSFGAIATADSWSRFREGRHITVFAHVCRSDAAETVVRVFSHTSGWIRCQFTDRSWSLLSSSLS